MERKRVICLFLFVVLILIFSSCHRRYVSDIKLAMTKEDVVSLWGRTNLITYKTVNGTTLETWVYHFAGSGSICWITFNQDRVVANPQCDYPPVGRRYYSQSEQSGSRTIERSSIREGFFAIRLTEALRIGPVKSETEAENMLALVGIAPKNGWFADYPVTPDIIGELQNAIAVAADSGKIAMKKSEAIHVPEDLVIEIESQYFRRTPFTTDYYTHTPTAIESFTESFRSVARYLTDQFFSNKRNYKKWPSVQKSEEARRLETEPAAKEAREAGEAQEAKERELARIKEEEARLAQKAELEKSLVAKKERGIEGEVFESKLLKEIRFDYDKYDIRREDEEILKEYAAFLKKNLNMKIQIEGHCDERGTSEYNFALGERRANSTKRYLVSLGIASERISTISFGKERPMDPGHNEEAWAKNRRGTAHIVVLSK